jgi:hypothetical protein
MNLVLKEENIASLIYFIRGEKVMLDSDLALLYGVETKRLKEAVRRNIDRFPEDFMFVLTTDEFYVLRTQIASFNLKAHAIYSDQNSLRTQIASLKKGRGEHAKYPPMVFTEQGVAMLSGVLKSKRAVEVNIAIMRTFVQVRKLLQGNKELQLKLKDLEKLMNDRFTDHDKKIQMIFEAIRQLIQKKNEPLTPIGFKTKK